MVRMQRTPRYPIGTRIKKHFPGYNEPFAGTVDQFAVASGFYHITYDDGDSEEMTEDDVESHFVATPKPRVNVAIGVGPHATPAPGNDNNSNESDGDDEPEVVDVTEAYGIYQLVGKKVCKKQVQADGSPVVVTGAVSTYFPATKMYRVVYGNGTTDDMTYREVVDSIPLVASVAAPTKKNKRKTQTNGQPTETPSVQPSPTNKKRKGEADARTEKTKKKKSDENNDRSNTDDVDDGMEEEPTSVFDSAVDTNETSFVWSKTRAYETVRAVLYMVATTSSVESEAVKVLEQKGLKAKNALVKFIDLGGFDVLVERLKEWIKSKEHEAGALAILKVLTVIPGVTPQAISSSKMGRLLGRIAKRRDIAEGLDHLISDMASYVIKIWKERIIDKKLDEDPTALDDTIEPRKPKLDKSDRKLDAKDTKQDSSSSFKKPELSKQEPKSDKPSNKPEAKPEIKKSSLQSSRVSNSLPHQRSKSAHHLSALMGARRTGDLLGHALGRRSRPLGADHARRQQRSTILLDSIADRQLKNSEAQRRREAESGASGSGSGTHVGGADTWVASRVRFGDISTLEFLKECEVTRLLDKPGAGGFRPRNTAVATRVPPKDKQPTKSILRVKLGVAEREAIAAEVEAENRSRGNDYYADGDDDGRVLTETALLAMVVGGGERLQSSSTTKDSAKQGEEAEREHKQAPKSPKNVFAPPSPPRRHEESDDEFELTTNDDDEEPLPDSIMISVPSPASDELDEALRRVEGDTPTKNDEQLLPALPIVERRVDNDGYFFSGAASPVVSSDAESDNDQSMEEGEVTPPRECPSVDASPASSVSLPSLSDLVVPSPSDAPADPQQSSPSDTPVTDLTVPSLNVTPETHIEVPPPSDASAEAGDSAEMLAKLQTEVDVS